MVMVMDMEMEMEIEMESVVVHRRWLRHECLGIQYGDRRLRMMKVWLNDIDVGLSSHQKRMCGWNPQ